MGDRMPLLDRLAEAASVRKAFGDAVERDGTLVIPVARVSGGGGGGEGTAPGGDQGEGAGGGYGLIVRPVGVFVVKDGKVSWQPAVDVTRIVLGGQAIAVIALLTIRSILRRRRSRHGQ